MAGYEEMQSSLDLLLGSAIGLFVSFLWAVEINVYKSQSEVATPLAISTLKMWLSFVFMTILMIILFRVATFSVPIESIVYLVASVILNYIVGDIAFLTSQKRIGVSYAYPITMTYPIVTYVIAIYVVLEEFLLTRFVGIILAVVGVILISREQGSNHNVESISTFDKVGIALALFATLCWGLGSVLLQLGVTDVNAIDANFVRMGFGSGIITPLFLASIRNGSPKPTRRAAKMVLVAAFFGMALGSLLYTYAVKLIGASITAVLGSVSPLFALPISIFFLKESYSNKSILGALMTVFGVILVVVIV
jgi:drug/metabolite transporter (DMT)-like permease